MFSKILIANRGEIAVRIIRACNEMGIRTVAVYSEADAQALHVNLADESYCIGPALLKDSYLNMTAIIDVAIATGCQAIHPGYGLLSENPRFAELCEKCNIKFIGPHYSVIARMGDKDEARRTMKAAGVPVVPGLDEITDIAEAKKFASEIGYPVIVKAAAGGGGRGHPHRLEGRGLRNGRADRFRRGAERLRQRQVLSGKVSHRRQTRRDADRRGRAGQRRLPGRARLLHAAQEPEADRGEPLRRPQSRRRARKMMRCAVLAAKTVHYTNLGTIEFLLDKQGKFYFMEMNTRLQVEHPVTEYVTGIDVVKWQIRIAAGIEFIYKQEDIRLRGCAIECRINSEDARNNFRPSCGQIKFMHIPGGPWVRFDTAIYQDYSIPPYYDSMIGKLIVYARERTEAIRKMQAALCELVIDGVHTNAEFSSDVLARPEFKDGTYCTNFLEKFLKNYR